jgi:uncharacterized protein (TIRG00374 family)
MSLLLKVSVTAILLCVILWQLGGVGGVAAVMSRMHPGYVALVLLVNTADRALMTFKWVMLLRSRGVQLPFFYGMKIYCASMVWGTFLPATIGADVARAFSTTRIGLDSNVVVSSIIIERMIGFLSALFVGLLSLLLLSLYGSLDSRFDGAWSLGLMMLAAATALFAASLSQRAFRWIRGRFPSALKKVAIMQRLGQFHETYRSYSDDKKTLTQFFGLTLLEQLLPIVHSWLIARALGVEISLLFIAGVVPLTILISRIPISIDGLGVFEGIFIVLMSLAGVPPTEAIAISLVGRILQTVSWLPWWLAHVLETREFRVPRPA